MPTLVYNTGFEHGLNNLANNLPVSASLVSPQAAPVPSTTSLDNIITAAAARSGGFGMRSFGTNTTAFRGMPVPGVTTVSVIRFYARLNNALPTAKCLLAELAGGTAACQLYISSTGQITLETGGSVIDTGPTLAVAQWYRFDFLYEKVSTNLQLTWEVDGVDQGTTSWAASGSPPGAVVYLGGDGTGTFSIDYDDYAVSLTATDYPIGPGFCLPHVPSTLTLHTAGTYVQGATTTGITTASWALVDDADLSTANADYIRQTGGSATANSNPSLGFPHTMPSNAASINGVRCAIRYGAAATGANTQRHYISANGVNTYLHGGAAAQPTVGILNCYSGMQVDNGGFAWTDAMVDSMAYRWGTGLGTDVNPVPILYGVMVEIDYREVVFSNNFEGQADGTSITVANSGGLSGDPWTATSGTGALGSNVAAHGTKGLFTGASAGDRWVQWQTPAQPAIFGRVNLRTGTPASNQRFIFIGDGSNAQAAAIDFDTTRKIRVYNSANVLLATSTVALPVDTWCRIEYNFAATGAWEVRIYTSMDSTSTSEILSGSAASLGAGYAYNRFGRIYVDSPSYYLDDIAISTQGWIGAVNPTVPSGTSQTLTDAFGLSDLAQPDAQIIRPITDLSGVVDLATPTLVGQRALASSQAMADALTYQVFKSYTWVASDTAALADAVATVEAYVRSVTSSAGLTDTQQPDTQMVRPLSSLLAAVDDLTDLASLSRSATDAEGAADAMSQDHVSAQAYAQTLADNAGVADAVATIEAYVRAAAAIAGLTDAATSVEAYARAATDAEGLVDDAADVTSQVRATTDAEGLVDGVVADAARQANLTDVASLGDSATPSVAYLESVTDAQGAVDAASSSGTHVRGATDALGMVDDLADELLMVVSQTLADSASLADSVVRVVAAARPAADAAGLTDALSWVTASGRLVTDTTGLVDALGRATGTQRAATDAAGLTDGVARVTAIARTADDLRAAADTLTRVAGSFAIVMDDEGLTDSSTSSVYTVSPFTVVQWWSGTEWLSGALFMWDGDDWVPTTIKMWTGASWIDLTGA